MKIITTLLITLLGWSGLMGQCLTSVKIKHSLPECFDRGNKSYLALAFFEDGDHTISSSTKKVIIRDEHDNEISRKEFSLKPSYTYADTFDISQSMSRWIFVDYFSNAECVTTKAIETKRLPKYTLETLQKNCGDSLEINFKTVEEPLWITWENGIIATSKTIAFGGMYQITVSNEDGCTIIDSLYFERPSEISLDISHSNIRCKSLVYQELNATARGGVPPYTYTWSNGQDQISSPKPTAYSLDNPSISLRITDAYGCELNRTITLPDSNPGNQPQEEQVLLDALPEGCDQTVASPAELGSRMEVTLVLEKDEVCDIEPRFPLSGGFPLGGVYSGPNVSFDPTDGLYYFTPQLGVSAIYTIRYTATDPATGMQASATDRLAVQAFVFDFFPEFDSICNNAQPFFIERVPNLGGTIEGVGVQFDPINNEFIFSPQAIPPGTYELHFIYTAVFLSGYSCSSSRSKIVEVLPVPIIEIDAFADIEACELENFDVTPEINNLTSFNDVQFSWTGPNNFTSNQLQLNFVDVSPDLSGTYRLLAIGDFECVGSAELNMVINEIPGITCESASSVNCFGELNGIAGVNIQSTRPTTNILWSTGATTEFISGLAAGIYTVTVTDDLGCSNVCSIEITQPDPVENFFSDIQQTLCSDVNNGGALMNISGGTLPYSIQWSTGSQEANPSNLNPGMNYVTVTDARGCILIDSVFIPSPLEIEITVSSSEHCSNVVQSIPVSVTGGNSNQYTYFWSIIDAGTTDLTNSMLSTNQQDGTLSFPANVANPGTANFRLIVTDALGCTAETTVSSTTRPIPTVSLMGEDQCQNQVRTITSVSSSSNGPILQNQWNIINNSTTAGNVTLSNTQSPNVTVSSLNASPGILTLGLIVTDSQGCTASEQISTEIIRNNVAGMNSSITLCNAAVNTARNLFDALEGNPDPGGTWSLAMGSGPQFINSESVEFYNVEPGMYQFLYVIPANGPCADVTAVLDVDVTTCFDLALEKTLARTAPFYRGDTVRFHIQVFNQGLIPAFDVEVRDYLPEGLSFDQNLSNTATPNNPNSWTQLQSNEISTTIPQINPGSSVQLSLVLRIDQDAPEDLLRNEAEIVYYTNGEDPLPYDEDDRICIDPPIENNDDIDDDSNGETDNCEDDDQFDFEELPLCPEIVLNLSVAWCVEPQNSNQPISLTSTGIIGLLQSQIQTSGLFLQYSIDGIFLDRQSAFLGQNPITSTSPISNNFFIRLLVPYGCVYVLPFELIVSISPEIQVMLSDVIAGIGETAIFSAQTNQQNVTYLWQEFTVNGFQDLPNSNLQALVIPTVQFSDNGRRFQVIVTLNQPNSCSTSSAIASLSLPDLPPLVCDDLVRVSFDANCEAFITPPQILNDEYNYGFLEVRITRNGQAVPNPVTLDYVNQLLTVEVRNTLDGNVCWGNIIVEDKLPPRLICPDTIRTVCTDTDIQQAMPQIIESCDSNPSLQLISNNLNTATCPDGIDGIRVLTYQATDRFGNTSQTCQSVIVYERVLVDQITVQSNLTLACPLQNTIASWDQNSNGYPDVFEVAKPQFNGIDLVHANAQNPNGVLGNNLCQINFSFTDSRIDICPAQFNILRTWSILDWCTGTVRTLPQLIHVVDNQGPIVQCLTPNIDEFVNEGDCSRSLMIPLQLSIQDCSATTVRIEYTSTNDVNPNFAIANWLPAQMTPNGQAFSVFNMPIGFTYIRYVVTDACGNVSSCMTRVNIRDRQSPVAICKEFTVTTLNSNGFARINASSLNNDSYDACGPITIQIRKLGNSCGNNPNVWREWVEFCCEDFNRNNMVELLTTDQSGNTSVCMGNVFVQNKIIPTITCPASITISCTQDISDTSLTGTPTIQNNVCNQLTQLTYTDVPSVNSCGIGTIRRNWTLSRAGTTLANCTQQITVINDQNFGFADITWPQNIDLEGCIGITTDPSVTGRPSFAPKACSLVSASYTDDVFNFAEGACAKILRNWSVIDWCREPIGQGVPTIWTYTQVIKINNFAKPEFVPVSNQTFCIEDNSCSRSITLSRNATDDCTPTHELKWRYELDLDGNGTIDERGTTSSFAYTYQPGSHVVNWTVEDRCGNRAHTSQTITVRDCKKPTPYCHADLITVLMPVEKVVEFSAASFDLGSKDNCSTNLRFAFSENPADATRTFTCAHVGTQVVQMYVFDEAGNFDYCTVLLDIQDNGNSCGNSIQELPISGRVATVNGLEIRDVAIGYTDLPNAETKISMTDATGKYKTQNIQVGRTVDLKPSLNDRFREGLTTLDIVLIQRHILGIERFDIPEKVLAADMNDDRRVTAADLVELRKLILGVTEKMPNNPHWKFIWKNGDQPTLDQPFVYEHQAFLSSLDSSHTKQDFTAIKVGDVNFSLVNNLAQEEVSLRNRPTKTIQILDQKLNRGEQVLVPVTIDQMENWVSSQFGFRFDEKVLGLVDIRSGAMDLSQQNHHFNGENHLAFSWNMEDAQSFDPSIPLFYLAFDVYQSGKLSDVLQLSSDQIASEIVDGDWAAHQLGLRYRESAAQQVLVSQNLPNPFTHQTEITIDSPENQWVRIELSGSDGTKLGSKNSYLLQGKNTIRLTEEEFKDYRGVIITNIQSATWSKSMKMIRLE